jgi:hypothetical protein
MLAFDLKTFKAPLTSIILNNDPAAYRLVLTSVKSIGVQPRRPAGGLTPLPDGVKR